MNAIIKKERRLLRPTFVATVAITVASALIFNGSEASDIVMIVFAVGAGLMAASVFGSEFNARTMLLLLSQPVPRHQIWQEKMRELGLELAASFVVLLISLAFLVRGEGRLQSFSASSVMMLAVAPLVAFCSTPFASLSIRNTLGAMAATIGFPWVLVMLLLGADWLVSHALLGWDRFLLDKVSTWSSHLFVSIVVLAVLIYCSVLYWLGYRTFLDFEIMDSQSQDVALPAVVEDKLAGWTEGLVPGFTGPVASLVRKELRLHRVSFIVVGSLVLVTPFLAVARMLHRSDLTGGLLLAPLMVCIILIPFLTGLATVAEERNLGVMNWQLTLPVSPATQWKVKLLVAFCTCIVLGVMIPGLLLYIGHLPFGFWKSASQLLSDEIDHLLSYGYLGMLYCLLFSLVVFASTITNNVTRGMVAALGLATAGSIAVPLGSYAFNQLFPWTFYQFDIPYVPQWFAGRWLPYENRLLLFSFMLTASLVYLFVINWFSYTNFKNGLISARRLWFQAATILLLAGVLTFAVRMAAALTEIILLDAK